jgi:predicted permease
MHTLIQDLRYAVRLALKRPALTLVTVLALGIGVGGNTATFSVFNALLLRPLPVAEPDRVVRVFGASNEGGFDVLSYPNAADLAARATTLSSVALHNQSFVSVGVGDSIDSAAVELVSGNYFSTLGVTPAMGRPLTPADDPVDRGEPVAVISDGWWRSRHGAARDVIGTTLHLNGAAFTIVGVAPPSFRGSYDAWATDVWVPLMTYATVRPRGLQITRRGWGWLNATARLAPGATIEQASAELDTIANALGREYQSARGLRAHAVAAMALPEDMIPGLRRVLFFALLVVGLSLCAACANVANAQLATVISRRREIAVRMAMGATRGRVLRQWITESALLAAAAAAVGLLIALWANEGLMWLRPPQPDLQNVGTDLSLDVRVLSFAILMAAVTALLFGGLPAVRAARSDVTAPLKEDGVTATGTRRRLWAQRTLVVAQVAVSVILLVSAGLLVRSLSAAAAFDIGFATDRLLLAEASTEGLGYEPARTRAYYRDTMGAIAALPGVEAVTFAAVVPLSQMRESRGVVIEGHRAPDGSRFISTAANLVATNYFAVAGIPIVRGRGFLAQDGDPAAAPVAIVNETMARRYWNGNAVGQQLQLGGNMPPVQVVGVARDITYYSIGEAPRPYLYLPFGRETTGGLVFHVRSAAAPVTLAASLRGVLRASDPRIRAPGVLTFDEVRQLPLYPSRAMAAVSSTFGILALALTAIGLYGVVLYAVSQRTREFAVRLALGASPHQIVRGVVRQGLVMAVGGVAAGAAGAALLGSLLRGFLVGVSPLDPLTFVGWSVAVLGIALVATYLPARRATRIDPAAALTGRS